MLRDLASQQIIEKIPYSDENVKDNPFYQDFLVFLKYIEENALELTETKNLRLKHLAKINDLLIRKRPMEEKILDHIYRVRSEDEMRYLRILDALAEVMKITKREKETKNSEGS